MFHKFSITGCSGILLFLALVSCDEPKLKLGDFDPGSDSETSSNTDNDSEGPIIIGDGDADIDTDTRTGLELGDPIEMDCSVCPQVGGSVEAMICALDICNDVFVLENAIEPVSPFRPDFPPENNYRAVKHFGDADNELDPRLGNSYALLGTGSVIDPQMGHNDVCTDTDDPASYVIDKFGEDPWIFDVMEWTIKLIAPPGAEAFSFKYVFFSAEYDEWISSIFNDKFYVILNAPKTTDGEDRVINYTDCRDPYSYSDFNDASCDTPSGYCCYIAINSAVSDCCWYPYQSAYAPDSSKASCSQGNDDNTDISGTGFECAVNMASDSTVKGSSTGWLMTAWPIRAGETFTLTFHIHDTNDAQWDSMVLIDAFQFHGESRDFGTISID